MKLGAQKSFRPTARARSPYSGEVRPLKPHPQTRAGRGAPSDLTVFSDSHLPGASAGGAMPPMNELEAEMKVLTWLLWINMALILACVAIAVLREFG
jgi:hypothetical protein